MKRIFLGFVLLGVTFAAGCAKEEVKTQAISPEIKSKRGESCGATNDCVSGLICVSNHCIQNDYPIMATAKECDIIGCESTADCCDDFVAPIECDSYQEQCDLGFTEYCGYVDLYCQCTLECHDEQCVTQQPACATDLDCAYFCQDEQCVQCRDSEDCGTDSTCTDGFCVGSCTQNEECAIFNECQDGACVESGCTTDRECILFSGDAQSICTDDHTCKTPCESNAQCGELFVCTAGACEFVGCESPADCRAYFAHQGVFLNLGDQVVCRDIQ